MEDTFEFKPPSLPNVGLPSFINLTPYAIARSKEIQIMKHVLASGSSCTKLAFQKIPNHMRRRAMSHNAKRLPRKLREIHLRQMMKSGLPPKLKRPSRKYRRKPKHLLEEYIKRQKKIKWLFTHIWHAKRFHMINKWGFKIPWKSCNKSFRFSYRATSKHCLLQDISYIQCIELTGNVEYIKNKFSEITNRNLGLSIGAKSYIKGYREGTVFLYNLNKSPIGLVNFQWKNNRNEEDINSLWIWAHASFYNEIMDTFTELFKLNKVELNLYTNSDNLIVRELDTDLCRFRLSGYLSNAVVQNCFKCFDSKNFTTTNFTKWFESLNEQEKINVEEQKKYFESFKAPSSSILPLNIIVPLLVCDPRLNLPEKRTKSQITDYSYINVDINNHLGASFLWDQDMRGTVKSCVPLGKDFDNLNKNKLIPGSNISNFGCPVPIILIQRPGSISCNTVFNSGWDIIIHSSWARIVWVSLIMWGARAGGLRESIHSDFEMGKPNFLYPDTKAGQEEELNIKNELKIKYFKNPPNKRINFVRNGIASPFECNWKLLIKEWSEDSTENFTVLREKNKLEMLQNTLRNSLNKPSIESNLLIPVQIECIGKGCINSFAIICLPKSEDINKAPMETKKIDKNTLIRKDLRKQHKNLLKRLNRRRKRARKINKPVQRTDKEMLKKYTETMRSLWLPEATTIRNYCSREIIGFIQEGGFSLSLGKSKGVGYIASGAIPLLNKNNKILVRNTNSLQYFVCTIKIITEL